jgi:hypothetical protein
MIAFPGDEYIATPADLTYKLALPPTVSPVKRDGRQPYHEPALFMNTFAAIADPLLRRAFGRRARRSVGQHTAGEWRPSSWRPVRQVGQTPSQTTEPVPLGYELL